MDLCEDIAHLDKPVRVRRNSVCYPRQPVQEQLRDPDAILLLHGDLGHELLKHARVGKAALCPLDVEKLEEAATQAAVYVPLVVLPLDVEHCGRNVEDPVRGLPHRIM